MMKLEALPDVPRWAVLAAHAVPLLVLPSGIWRVALTFGAPVARVDDPPHQQTSHIAGCRICAHERTLHG
ncbi:hypothetical protein [Streptomyces sp. NPDC047141]|uniref:hypothetical protein n=1 Tax=Streptomyces sp. NPDC047141 TaxID=3155738 RepID=UPI0033D9D88B